MKHLLFFFLSAVALIFCGCNDSNENEKQSVRNDSAGTREVSTAKNSRGPECYAQRTSTDTIQLSFTQNDSTVNGRLSINRSGKDRNNGTFIGEMKGDTLLALYSFQSEGITSVREIAFLRKENVMIEGYGPISQRNGKSIFTDHAKLTFDAKMELIKLPCE